MSNEYVERLLRDGVAKGIFEENDGKFRLTEKGEQTAEYALVASQEARNVYNTLCVQYGRPKDQIRAIEVVYMPHLRMFGCIAAGRLFMETSANTLMRKALQAINDQEQEQENG